MSERYLVRWQRASAKNLGPWRRLLLAPNVLCACPQHPDDEDLYLDAVALNLHNFYTGLERVLYHIAATLDEAVPESRDWHQELLKQMAEERPQIRPAVISEETRELLDEYLRFRHVVRNI